MPTLLRELSDRIAFNYPTFEPYLFFYFFIPDVFYAERTSTRLTPPSLFTVAIKTIPFYIFLMTPRTLFFLSFIKPFQHFLLILRLAYVQIQCLKAHIFDYYAHSEILPKVNSKNLSLAFLITPSGLNNIHSEGKRRR